MITHCTKCGKYDCQCCEVQNSIDKHGIVYFHDHNGSRVDYPAGITFSDGYTQPTGDTTTQPNRKEGLRG